MPRVDWLGYKKKLLYGLSFCNDMITRERRTGEQASKKLYVRITRFRELFLYGIIGGICATLDFVVYALLCKSIPVLAANVISVHFGIICSFFLNRRYNFRINDKTAVRFLSFYIVGLLGLGISEVMIYLLISLVHLDNITSKLVTVVVVALFQFVLNKTVTFKKSHNG